MTDEPDGKPRTGEMVRAGSQRGDGGGRLPPGQILTGKFPVLDLGVRPDIPPGKWTLQVSGMVERPFEADFAALMRMPMTQMTVDIHCVTTWSRFDCLFGGVMTTVLAEQAGLRPEARFVSLVSWDGYTTNVTRGVFLAGNAMLATHFDGRPLEKAHGGPVRLVFPDVYFWKSAKWIREIRFTDQEIPGFWEQRGYHMRGDPWQEERYG